MQWIRIQTPQQGKLCKEARRRWSTTCHKDTAEETVSDDIGLKLIISQLCEKLRLFKPLWSTVLCSGSPSTLMLWPTGSAKGILQSKVKTSTVLIAAVATLPWSAVLLFHCLR